MSTVYSVKPGAAKGQHLKHRLRFSCRSRRWTPPVLAARSARPLPARGHPHAQTGSELRGVTHPHVSPGFGGDHRHGAAPTPSDCSGELRHRSSAPNTLAISPGLASTFDERSNGYFAGQGALVRVIHLSHPDPVEFGSAGRTIAPERRINGRTNNGRKVCLAASAHARQHAHRPSSTLGQLACALEGSPSSSARAAGPGSPCVSSGFERPRTFTQRLQVSLEQGSPPSWLHPIWPNH